jgi:hypothetical protein
MTGVAHKIFDDTRSKLVHEFGDGPMSDADVNKVGHRLFGKKWAGVGSADAHFKPVHDRYFVLNTGHANSKGAHWVAGYRSPRGQVYAFDSFGRGTPVVLPGIARRTPQEGHGIVVDANREQVQEDGTDVCGHLSLAWLNAVHRAGLMPTLRLFNHTREERHALAAAVHDV